MSFTGYRVYRGRGSLGSVDWTTPVGEAGADATSVQLAGLGHEPGAGYTYVLRPVLADLETGDVSCVVRVAFDGEGDWLGDRPGPVRALSAAVEPAGKIRLRWRPAAEGAAADEYPVHVGSTLPVDTATDPATVITAVGDVEHQAELTFADGQTVYVAVVARTAAGAPSRAVTIGPIVADAAAPPTPVAYADATF